MPASPKPPPKLDAKTLRWCAKLLRLGANVNDGWAAYPGTGKRTAYGLDVAADDLRSHATSFDLAATRIERAAKHKGAR